MDPGDDDRHSDKLLLVKGRGGFGNRIHAALSGIVYARMTRRRLVVDWRDAVYSDDGTNVFPRYFRCAEAHPIDEIPETESVTPTHWRGHLHDTVAEIERTPPLAGRDVRRESSVDLTRLDHPERVAVMWSTDSRVAFLASRHRRAFAAVGGGAPIGLLRRLLRDTLVPGPAIRERVEEVVGGFGGKPTIGVHVRYSDRRIDLLAVRRRVETLLRRVPDAQIFLSTDNVEVKTLFEGAYPRVITAPQWYPPPGSPAHHYRDRPGRYALGVDALVDLYTLAECDYLIGDATSSFARIAVLRSRAPSSHIAYVNRGAELRRRLHDALEGVSPRLAYEAASAYERIVERSR